MKFTKGFKEGIKSYYNDNAAKIIKGLKISKEVYFFLIYLTVFLNKNPDPKTFNKLADFTRRDYPKKKRAYGWVYAYQVHQWLKGVNTLQEYLKKLKITDFKKINGLIYDYLKVSPTIQGQAVMDMGEFFQKTIPSQGIKNIMVSPLSLTKLFSVASMLFFPTTTGGETQEEFNTRWDLTKFLTNDYNDRMNKEKPRDFYVKPGEGDDIKETKQRFSELDARKFKDPRMILLYLVVGYMIYKTMAD